MRNYFALALGLSGCAALTYQVAWQRILTQIIGSDSVSIVLVVTIFMICLGVGAELARLILRKNRSQQKALVIYVAIEIAVGLYGAISIPFFRSVNSYFSGRFGDSFYFDFVLNLVLLAPPVIGMGLTTPLIVEATKQNLKNVGRTAGFLYGFNMAGAAAGALLTGLIFIEMTGLIGTTWLAAAMNILAALLAIVAIKKANFSVPPKETQTPEQAIKIPKRVATASILFGFGTLAIQVIFFRVLSNYFTLSTIVFPVVLCAYLCLMALGQTIGGYLADRFTANLVKVITVLFCSGSLLFLLALKFPPHWAAKIGALRFTTFNGSLISKDFGQLIGDPSPGIVFIFSSLFMLSVVPWSGLFTVMFRLATERIEDAGDRFASIYTLYTVGNVAGTFVCGFFLLPYLGSGATAAVTIAIVGLGCFVLFLSKATMGSLRSQGLIFTSMALGFLACFLMPKNYYMSFHLGDYTVADVFEGKTGVATVVPTSTFYTIIDINRTASASALNREPGEGDQYEAWRWNHSELMALDPNFRPKNILVIGIGHAYLIDALLDLPFVEKITIVDISPEVVSAVKKYTKTATKRVFSDPRVEIVIADGRRFVHNAINRGERYDLIQNKINEPWHAGGGNLFTEEFFTMERSLLNPGGYLSTRPLNGHLNDGVKVFGNAVWTGYYHLFFRNGPALEIKHAVVSKDISDAWTRNIPGKHSPNETIRKSIDVAFFTEVPENLVSDSNTDNYPNFEYYWLRKRLGRWISPQQQLTNQNASSVLHSIPVVFN